MEVGMVWEVVPKSGRLLSALEMHLFMVKLSNQIRNGGPFYCQQNLKPS